MSYISPQAHKYLRSYTLATEPQKPVLASAGSSVADAKARFSSKASSALLRTADLLSDVRAGIERNELMTDPGRSNQRLLDSAIAVMTDTLGEVSSTSRSSNPGRNSGIDVYRSVQVQSNQLEQYLVGFLSQVKNLKVNSIDESRRAVVTLDELEERIRKIALDGQVQPFDEII